eukprot:7691243-Pyramimonas_sp.AAC.1
MLVPAPPLEVFLERSWGLRTSWAVRGAYWTAWALSWVPLRPPWGDSWDPLGCLGASGSRERGNPKNLQNPPQTNEF